MRKGNSYWGLEKILRIGKENLNEKHFSKQDLMNICEGSKRSTHPLGARRGEGMAIKDKKNSK